MPEANPAVRERIVTRETKATGLPRPEIERAVLAKLERETAEIWVRWVFSAVFILSGIVSGAMAFRKVRAWDYLAVITSLGYLVAWLQWLTAYTLPDEHTIFDTYISQFFNAVGLHSPTVTALFFWNDLVLPIFHFFIVTFLPYAYWGGGGARTG